MKPNTWWETLTRRLGRFRKPHERSAFAARYGDADMVPDWFSTYPNMFAFDAPPKLSRLERLLVRLGLRKAPPPPKPAPQYKANVRVRRPEGTTFADARPTLSEAHELARQENEDMRKAFSEGFKRIIAAIPDEAKREWERTVGAPWPEEYGGAPKPDSAAGVATTIDRDDSRHWVVGPDGKRRPMVFAESKSEPKVHDLGGGVLMLESDRPLTEAEWREAAEKHMRRVRAKEQN